MMNEYNQKGFTLVELLAVLTILATILLLVAPTVLNTIKKSEASVDKENIVRYGRAIKQAVLEYQLENSSDVSGTYTYSSDKKYLVNTENSDVNFKLAYEGSNIMCDVILVDSYGEVYLEKCSINNKSVAYTYGVKEDFVPQPDLYDNTLTPVRYNGVNWVVADTTEKWYDYDKQEWANAVLLDSDVSKSVGDTVAVDGTKALAMYVWIPRFEYKVEGVYGKGGISISQPGEIEINFMLDGVTTPTKGYKEHSAFTFGGETISGIWVAKFELSHENKITTSTGCTTVTCSEGNYLRILPDKQSLRKNAISRFYYAIKSMEQSGNVFGLDSQKSDSHMIKTNEWSAVAFLTQSKYGKYGNDSFSGVNKEVYINNSSSFYTGRSGGSYSGNASSATYGSYTYDGYLLSSGTNTKTSTKDINKVSSTTGNITGIYDMSGGSYEYLMGVVAESDGTIVLGQSAFTQIPENSKYYNVYKNLSGSNSAKFNACNNGPCYGDIITETSGWYGDYNNIVRSSVPWFGVGGSYSDGAKAGIFSTATVQGGESSSISTRAVLTKNTTSFEYKKYNNGEIVYYDVESGLKCTNYNTDNSKTGYNGIDNRSGNQNSCLKFYAFNDNGGNKINLLLDHNTTATVLWNSNGDNSSGPTEIMEKLKDDTKKWKGTISPSNYTTGILNREYTVNYDNYNARIITATEIADITGNIGWNENTEGTDKFYFDTRTSTQSSTCNSSSTTGCNFGWLYDRTSTSCASKGCLNNSNVKTNGYWTISSSATISTEDLHKEYCKGNVNYGVGDSARLSITCPNYPNYYGVRPVIEVLKSKLQ